MISVEIDISGAAALSSRMRALHARLGPEMLEAMGRGMANGLRKHFLERNQTPNRLGGERTNFWQGVASATQAPIVSGGNSVHVAVSHPHILQKLRGGLIRPREKKAIAIPLNGKAYGKSPTVFPLLAFLPSGSSGPGGAIGYLVEGERKKVTRGKNKGKEVIRAKKGGSLLYMLSRGIYQQPDPATLPGDAALLDAAASAGEDFIDALDAGAV